MTTSSPENNSAWNGVERRLNGTSPNRVAILCDAVCPPRAPAADPTRRPAPDYREEHLSQPRPAAC